MNNESLLLQQAERQNKLIDALLKENAYLKGVISAYLLPGIDESKPELRLLKVLVEESSTQSAVVITAEGNIGFPHALVNINEGNVGLINALVDSNKGSNGSLNSFVHSGDGNSGSKNASIRSNKGNSGVKNAFATKIEGNKKEILAKLAAGIRPFMLYSTYVSQVNTAKILLQLYQNPATPLAELRSLTGLSPDGMAKRIMALKKAGLIVRFSAPLRYVLTEKAVGLLK